MSTEPPENERSGPGFRQALEAAGRTAALLGAVWLAGQVRSRLESGQQAPGATPQDVVLIGISEGLERNREVSVTDSIDADEAAHSAFDLMQQVLRDLPRAPAPATVEVAAQVAVLLLRSGISRDRVREILNKIFGDDFLPPKEYADPADEDPDEETAEPEPDEPAPETEGEHEEASAEGEGQPDGESDDEQS